MGLPPFEIDYFSRPNSTKINGDDTFEREKNKSYVLMCSSVVRSHIRLSTVTDHVRRRFRLRLPVNINYSSLHQRETLVLSSSIGSPALIASADSHRHLLGLKLIASAAALSTAWLILSVIPAILALRKASESLENLLDSVRVQLPDAMADVRLSGMEISDLTLELSDFGQLITQRVKSSTHVARIAEEKLRQFATLSATGTRTWAAFSSKNDTNNPPLAKSVRDMKQGIIEFRSSLLMFSTFIYYYRLIRNFTAARAHDKNR